MIDPAATAEATTRQPDGRPRPLISILTEAKNRRHSRLGVDCLDGLRRQTFPLDRVELVIAGPREATDLFRQTAAGLPVLAIRSVEIDDGSYFELKHAAASAASGEYFCFLDWDAVPDPGWLQAAMDALGSGADVVGGLMVFGSWRGLPSTGPVMLAASSITWQRDFAQASNVAFRAAVYRQHPYRLDDGRRAWWRQHESLVQSGLDLRFEPKQRATHSFTMWWWLFDQNARAGADTTRLRATLAASGGARTWRQRVIVKAGVLAPPITVLAGIARDLPRWLRYSTAIGLGGPRRAAYLPAVAAMSTLAHSVQLATMYFAMVAPEAARRFCDAR